MPGLMVARQPCGPRERLADVELVDLGAGDVHATLDALPSDLSTRSLQIIRNCLERAIRHAEIRHATAFGKPLVRDMTIAVSAPANIVAGLQGTSGLHLLPVADAAAPSVLAIWRQPERVTA